jgi:uncharacterized protein YdeI (YjbR/CyaY-like superfamily)
LCSHCGRTRGPPAVQTINTDKYFRDKESEEREHRVFERSKRGLRGFKNEYLREVYGRLSKAEKAVMERETEKRKERVRINSEEIKEIEDMRAARKGT